MASVDDTPTGPIKKKNYGDLDTTFNDATSVMKVKWSVFDFQLSKFRASPMGSFYSSESFAGKQSTRWRLEMYPNGWSPDNKGHCQLFLALRSKPAEYAKVIVYYTMRCLETGRSYQSIAKYTEPTGFGWLSGTQLLEDLHSLHSLSFECSFRILKVLDAAKHELYSLPFAIQDMARKQSFVWTINEALAHEVVTAPPQRQFDPVTALCGDGAWSLTLWPNGTKADSVGEVRVYLNLCALPQGVEAVKVKVKLRMSGMEEVVQFSKTLSYDNKGWGGKLGTFSSLQTAKEKVFVVSAKMKVAEFHSDLNGTVIDVEPLKGKEFDVDSMSMSVSVDSDDTETEKLREKVKDLERRLSPFKIEEESPARDDTLRSREGTLRSTEDTQREDVQKEDTQKEETSQREDSGEFKEEDSGDLKDEESEHTVDEPLQQVQLEAPGWKMMQRRTKSYVDYQPRCDLQKAVDEIAQMISECVAATASNQLSPLMLDSVKNFVTNAEWGTIDQEEVLKGHIFDGDQCLYLELTKKTTSTEKKSKGSDDEQLCVIAEAVFCFMVAANESARDDLQRIKKQDAADTLEYMDGLKGWTAVSQEMDVVDSMQEQKTACGMCSIL